ncbi:MAG: hypothetical protein CL675_10660 [Bdellovibrionaceae bacterium]|nr:hypothetical protein [Pseudobdellovibrionaceae bacterium]
MGFLKRFALVPVVFLMACSNQYRSLESDMDPAVVVAGAESVAPLLQQTSSQYAGVTAYDSSDPYSNIYYAESDFLTRFTEAPTNRSAAYGPIAGLLAVWDLPALTGMDIYHGDITDLVIYFFDRNNPELPRRAGLVIDMFVNSPELQGQYTLVYNQISDVQISEGQYYVDLELVNGASLDGLPINIRLVSNDVETQSDDLTATIALRVEVADPSTGEAVDIGKISVLQGFGGL